MSKKGIEALSESIEDRIDYFRKEFDMTYGEVVGVLEFIKFSMLRESFEDKEEMQL